MHLEETPLDVGYASEKISVQEKKTNNEVTLGGQNGKTQLILSVPFMDDTMKEELLSIEKDLPHGGEYEVTASLIIPKGFAELDALGNIEIFIDHKDEFADFYGVKLTGKPLDGSYTKALFLISKDGAIFYEEYLRDLDTPFNQEMLQRKIYAAQTCYTGKGCH